MDRNAAAFDVSHVLMRLTARMIDTKRFELGVRYDGARHGMAVRFVAGAVLIGCSLVASTFISDLAQRLPGARRAPDPLLWPRLATRTVRGVMRGG
jgi:hypothetical protein